MNIDSLATKSILVNIDSPIVEPILILFCYYIPFVDWIQKYNPTESRS